MRKVLIKLITSIALVGSFSVYAQQPNSLRPPAVPLVVSDPYLSIWSQADHLTDDVTRHWTNVPHPLVSLLEIDGKPFRLMGNDPSSVAALPQVSLTVTPTRTLYVFQNDQVQVRLSFMTPMLPADLDVLSRPVTYLTWSVKSIDGQRHAISIYDSTSSALAVNSADNEVTWNRGTAGDLTTLQAGAKLQTLFDPRGDEVRINWGYAYVAASTKLSQSSIGSSDALLQSFLHGGTLPSADDVPARAVNDRQPVMAFVFNLNQVSSEEVSRQVLIAYDELYAIDFSGQKLLPYWKRNGATMPLLLRQAGADYPKVLRECENFDRELMADLVQAGGERYAQIAALAYRQALAGSGLAADAKRQPLLFTKENTSNGDIATVDVIYPMEPMLLALSPTLAKASLVPVFTYAASARWKFPNAPHDLGHYPVASATGEAGEEMVVEESGNMLILADAIAKADGNADFSAPWWPQLALWAKYLEQYGLDPGDQLCTDDFMGHLAHNSNLSVKAIVALAAYGDLARRRGDVVTANRYTDLARTDAQHWIKMSNDGDHARLAFDRPGTWSQLYNLVWDRLLDLNVFPPEIASNEISYYKTRMKPYGLPLDSRTLTTKTDWTFWTATLATNRADFESFISPVYDYLNHTTARQPLADLYGVDTLNHGGFHARPVVGGLFIKMLDDQALWKKWAHNGNLKVGPWADIPPQPVLNVLIPKPNKPLLWRFSTEKPTGDWMAESFDDSSWSQGKTNDWQPKAPPSTNNDPRTAVTLTDAWMRTQVTLPDPLPANLVWILRGNSDGEIYLNGVRAGTTSDHGDPEPQAIYAIAASALKAGAPVTIAAHIHNKRVALTEIRLGTSMTP